LPVTRWSTSSAEVTERIALRLGSGSAGRSRLILWEAPDGRILLHLSTLRVAIREGWLLANLEVETQPTGRRRLQFVFFVGSDGEGDGMQAGSTIHADSPEGAQLAQFWGERLQRAIWDGVLDVLEGSLGVAERRHRGAPLRLLGFSSSAGELHADIAAGGSR
jgi:hypothetical protein